MPKGTEDGVLIYHCSEEECEMGPAFIYGLGKLLQAGQNCAVKNALEENPCRRRLLAHGAIRSSAEGKLDGFSEFLFHSPRKILPLREKSTLEAPKMILSLE